MKYSFIAFVAASLLAIAPASASDTDFSIAFEWGDTPACSTGRPSRIDNPEFSLAGVPEGTASIQFKMRDHDAPSYNHGGGRVSYEGEDTILPGAFAYKGPCPPRGSHTYQWIAKALDADGNVLDKAGASREFPEG